MVFLPVQECFKKYTHSPTDTGFVTAPESTRNAVLEDSCSTPAALPWPAEA